MATALRLLAVAGSQLSGGSGQRVCVRLALGLVSWHLRQNPSSLAKPAGWLLLTELSASRLWAHILIMSTFPGTEAPPCSHTGTFGLQCQRTQWNSCCIYPWKFRNKQLRCFTVVLSSHWVLGWFFLRESYICLFGKTLTGGYCYEAWANFHIFSILRLLYECKRN